MACGLAEGATGRKLAMVFSKHPSSPRSDERSRTSILRGFDRCPDFGRSDGDVARVPDHSCSIGIDKPSVCDEGDSSIISVPANSERASPQYLQLIRAL